MNYELTAFLFAAARVGLRPVVSLGEDLVAPAVAGFVVCVGGRTKTYPTAQEAADAFLVGTWPPRPERGGA